MTFSHYSRFGRVPVSTLEQLKMLTLGKDGTMLYRILDWENAYAQGTTMPRWFFEDYPSYTERIAALQFHKRWLRQKFRNIHVAKYRNTPIGWCMQDDFEHINMFVHKDFRGEGIAKELSIFWLHEFEMQQVKVWNIYAHKVVSSAVQHLAIPTKVSMHD